MYMRRLNVFLFMLQFNLCVCTVVPFNLNYVLFAVVLYSVHFIYNVYVTYKYKAT